MRPNRTGIGPVQSFPSRAVTAMGLMQVLHGYDQIQPHDQTIRVPSADGASLEAVTEFLDAALRMWDTDPRQAKSLVKVAVAMLRGGTGDGFAHAQPAAVVPRGPVLAPWQTHKVRDFIDASLGAPIRLQACADQARLSASYFSRAFKASFGVTFGHYIRHRRVERAQQLMLLSGRSLAEIALACGFADQAHYCRVFRDAVGLSPKAWRRRHLNLPPHE